MRIQYEFLYIFAVLALDGQEQLSSDWGPAVGVSELRTEAWQESGYSVKM